MACLDSGRVFHLTRHFLLRLTLIALFIFLTATVRVEPLCRPPETCEEKILAISGIMELLRGKTYNRGIGVATETPEQAMDRTLALRALHGMDFQNMSDFTAAYAMLGLLPPDFDLKPVFEKINQSHSRSHYDTDSATIFITDPGQTPGWNSPMVKKAAERLDMDEAAFILSRELARGLLEQNFDIERLSTAVPGNSDRSMAARSLVYGDAIMIQIDFLLRNTGINSLALKNPGQAIAQFAPLINLMDREKLDAMARVVRERITFPFMHGYEFALALRESGGWPLVDAAYQSPPLSTEQILHPEKYFDQRDIPVKITMPPLDDILDPDCDIVFDDVFGELGFRMFFEKWLDSRADAWSAAAGWGGDRIMAYKKSADGAPIVIFFTTWDTGEDALEFADFAKKAFAKLAGDPEATLIEVAGRDAMVIYNARNLTEKLRDRLWRAEKAPLMAPPPQPVAMDPQSPFFDDQIFFSMINQLPPSREHKYDNWIIDGLTYTNKTHGYRIAFPNDNWRFQPFMLGNQIITEFTAFHKGYVGSEITLEAFTPPLEGETDPMDDMILFVKQQMGNFEISSTGETTVAGLPAREITLSGFLLFPITARFTEVFAPDKVFIFTSAAASYLFETMRPEFDAIIDSFELLN